MRWEEVALPHTRMLSGVCIHVCVGVYVCRHALVCLQRGWRKRIMRGCVGGKLHEERRGETVVGGWWERETEGGREGEERETIGSGY